MKKWKAGVWFGLTFLIFSIIFFIQSLTLSYSGADGLGPGFFPLWLSGMLIILSLCYIYTTFKSEESESEPMPRGTELKNIVFILASMLIYLSVVPLLGFVLSSTIFLFALLFRYYRWHLNIGISVGASLFLFWIFAKVLSVTLPVNEFGW
jgi:putative tricarboxylic transport membrane protein